MGVAKDSVQVAAALIRDEERILICRRPGGKDLAYLWEFPGGKREAGETLRACLVRECREELGVDVAVGRIRMRLRHEYPAGYVDLSFYEARILSGALRLREHSEARWVLPEELRQFPLCPADRPMAEILEREGRGAGNGNSLEAGEEGSFRSSSE